MALSPDKKDLLARYEATGDEAAFREALPLYEQAAADGATPDDLLHYGYLLECYGRNRLREAVAQYERAIELDPSLDKARYQLIGARAGLLEPEREVAVYEERLAAAPGGVREHRFLASAYLAAGEHAKAREVAERGLSLAPDDPMLTYDLGEAKAKAGDPEGALADWRRALSLDTQSIGPLYMSAFLLEREGRVPEAITAWQSIIEWNQVRGHELDTEWPKRELQRLRGEDPEG
jgi:tetratricopeptide (TPR) repeat protein